MLITRFFLDDYQHFYNYYFYLCISDLLYSFCLESEQLSSHMLITKTNHDTSAEPQCMHHIPAWNPCDSVTWYGRSPASSHSHTAL